jgi:signal transduction histidine kinase/DNA-binding response OmpR family regulator
VRGLYRDPAGVLWIGSDGGGMSRFAGGRFTRYAMADGLADNQVWNIQEDDRGRFWMTSNQGLFSVDRAALEGFAAGRAKSIPSAWYGRPVEFNGTSQPSSERARDGTLLFASMEGLVLVDPARPASTQPRPPVRIGHVTAGGVRHFVEGGAVRLPAARRTFEVAYAALALSAPERVRFRYRLDGLDAGGAGWQDAGARRTAYYTAVPPGAYTFRVVATSTDGAWAPVEASLPITVAPYVYETWWFATGCVLGVVVLAGAGVRARLRGLRAREAELTREVRARTADVVREKVRAEAALGETEAARATIAAQAGRLQELDAAKTRFFGNISHEFRTPLTLIVGPLEDLLGGRHGELGGAVRAQHTLMLRNSRRLLRLINQILDLSKLEHGSLVLDLRTRDLRAFVGEVVGGFAPLAAQRGIALTVVASDPPCPAAFDAAHLEQVVLNLVANALKFTEPGGRVTVVVGLDAGRPSFAVRDTGAGIAPDQLPRVFDRFYQADRSPGHGAPTRARGGTGVGLALAREVVERHGGTIVAESVPGCGSTFTVVLPAPGDGDGVLDGSWPTSADGAADAAASVLVIDRGTAPDDRPAASMFRDRTTVLVVDDNADVRAYVRSVLEPGYRVLEAEDGAAGLERARTTLPDLIVADVMMPRLDGLALGRALKGDPMTDCIPVVLLTARADPADAVAGLRTGADDYVTKPFSGAVLRARVDNLIAGRRHLRDRFRAESPAAASVAADPHEAADGASRAPAALPCAAIEQRLRTIVAAHLADGAFNPEALACEAGLSYKQLYRALHDGLGTTPSRFIRTVRVEHAARLLSEGAGSVTEVAYAVGFNSLSYFNRAFRERYGAAPSEYLRTE